MNDIWYLLQKPLFWPKFIFLISDLEIYCYRFKYLCRVQFSMITFATDDKNCSAVYIIPDCPGFTGHILQFQKCAQYAYSLCHIVVCFRERICYIEYLY